MPPHDIPYPGTPVWDERRVRSIEHSIEKIEDEDKQQVIIERLEQLQKRVDRMAIFAMSAAGLLVGVLGFLIQFLAH